MKSTCAPSTTAKATAWAISAGSPGNSITCRTSASPPSGCCPSSLPPGATTATISPTIPTSTPPMARSRDFQTFLKQAHRRGLRVITEVVLNHTSDQHPWFQRSRTRPPGSRWRDFYVWSDTPDKYHGRAHHLQRFRNLQLDLGPGCQGLLLAPLLFASARPQLRQSRSARSHART